MTCGHDDSTINIILVLLLLLFSRLDTIHECDERKDRQTDSGRQQIPRLRIVLRV